MVVADFQLDLQTQPIKNRQENPLLYETPNFLKRTLMTNLLLNCGSFKIKQMQRVEVPRQYFILSRNDLCP